MTFRESDVIARIGGDEFAVLAHCDSDNVTATVIYVFQTVDVSEKKIKRIGSAYGQPNVMRSKQEKTSPVIQTAELVRKFSRNNTCVSGDSIK